MNSPFDEKRHNNVNFGEAVIVENKFHNKLNNVRNRQENPAEIEALKEEQRKQRQKHLATLYGVPAMQAAAHNFEQTIVPGKAQTVSAVVNFQEGMRVLEREGKRSTKFERPLTVGIVGFHQMQAVIDQFGVLAYEACLKRIEEILSGVVDIDIDTISKFANDRFMIILPETTGPNSTMVAETIRGYFDTVPIVYQQHRIPLKASVGLSCFPNHGQDWKVLLAKADLACDELFNRGGNALGFAPMG